jgi:glutamine synthetase
MSPITKILKYVQEQEIKFLDLRFTDSLGKEHHVSIPARLANENLFEHGKMFDGSSIMGWKDISESDMVLMPDPNRYFIDPFFEEKTLNIQCDVLEPNTMLPYERDPRSLAKRSEKYLQSTGIADVAYFGPEPEFFILDDVRWDISMKGAYYSIDSKEGAWNSGTSINGGNSGFRPKVKGGYFPVPPVDSSQDFRSAVCLTLEKIGIKVETHHHEVATANQNEIATEFSHLALKADEIQILKYIIQNMAHAYGKTATFMPKPLVGDNGSGMHCHQSLAKEGVNLFAGNSYSGLSELALFYIGGILHHAKALNAFTNSSTNSYKRLVPGFEAPVMLAYSARNRSAAIRIPYAHNDKARRIEVRFPDPAINPYLAFSAMLMAGIDGIRKKMYPGNPTDKDIFELSDSEKADIPTVCGSLEEAIIALDKDRNFLKEGGVFSDDLIDSYIKLKKAEITRLAMTTHPVEFDMYYCL